MALVQSDDQIGTIRSIEDVALAITPMSHSFAHVGSRGQSLDGNYLDDAVKRCEVAGIARE